MEGGERREKREERREKREERREKGGETTAEVAFFKALLHLSHLLGV